MSDPRVERGIDGQLPTDPAASPSSPLRTGVRRANPEAVIPSATRTGGGLRDRPHGVRSTTPPPQAAPRPIAHPRSRRRSEPWQPPKIGLPALHRPTFHRPTLHRPTWPLSIRQTISAAVATATVVAVVAGMVLLIPSKPVAAPGTGSVREVEFRAAAKPPTGAFYYGPYFVAHGVQMLMMGSDGKTSTVWSSTDGSNWESISDPGSFGAPNQRFVVLGFAGDGNGGLIAVGDGFTAGSKVAATAWHSRDGRTWTQAAVDYPTNTEMIGLAVRPGAIVSAGNGIAWFSRDGSSWTLVALPNATGYVPRAVRAWAGGFAIVAVSSGADARHTKAWISTDGKTWNEAAGTLDGFQVQDLVAYGNGLVAVGSQILTPDELATPSPSPSPTPTPGPTASGKTTPKPTPKPTKAPTPSAKASGASPSPSPTPEPAVEVATSWISPDGAHWYRGNALPIRESQALESVTQVFDSLVAVSSEPGGIPGATAAANKHASLWTSDDGMTWKPMTTGATALTRGRLAQFGKSLVLAGIDSSGNLAVLTGEVSLGSPLPVIAATPTPPFSISLQPGATPMVPGLTGDSTLGPVVATTDGFLVFVNGKTGATVFSSPDGSAWTTEAGPDVLAAAGPSGSPAATAAPATQAATGSPGAATSPTASPAASPAASPKASPNDASEAPSSAAPAGVSEVNAAALDTQGGIVAVGSMNGDSGQTAAVWHLSGNTWTAGTFGGNAPASLGSVAIHGGDYVAAADSSDGPRLLYSGDGATWIEATISGANAYTLTVSSYAAGFIASGVDASGKAAVWVSPDGLAWSASNWKLPASAGIVYATRKGLVTTSKGLTGNDSWWWSADGKAWQDSKLTTTGGCWGTLDAGFAAISAPSGGAASSTPAPSASATATWTVWASRDAQTWQQPITDPLSFGGSATCRIASLHQKVVIVGWAKAGVLQDFYGDLTGL
jgi:hypothetical protein